MKWKTGDRCRLRTLYDDVKGPHDAVVERVVGPMLRVHVISTDRRYWVRETSSSLMRP